MEQIPFGKVLLDLNLVTQEQLDEAISLQKECGQPLGQVLQDLGHIDEKTLKTILSIQHRRRGESISSQTMPESVPASVVTVDEGLSERLQDAPLVGYLRVAGELLASDLYLGTHEVPTVRVHGRLHRLPLPPTVPDRARELLFSVLSQELIETFKAEGAVDICLKIPPAGRFRLNLFRHDKGMTGIFRFIAEEIWPFESLNLPRVVESFAGKSNGLVLINGPMSCGKSTTLASLVDLINRSYRKHIITIEDPIEVIHESQLSLVSQREIGTHAESYAGALRAALREDPDVLVVGEMRDPETVSTAVTAAETGHLVFGTLHTQTSDRTILRVLDQFPPQKRAHVRTILAGTLRGIVSQQLVPNADGQGRSLAAEVLVVNSAVTNLIRDDRIWQIPGTMQVGSADGMCLMDDSLLALVNQGKITPQEAISRAVEKEKFQHLQVAH